MCHRNPKYLKVNSKKPCRRHPEDSLTRVVVLLMSWQVWSTRTRKGSKRFTTVEKLHNPDDNCTINDKVRKTQNTYTSRMINVIFCLLFVLSFHLPHVYIQLFFYKGSITSIFINLPPSVHLLSFVIRYLPGISLLFNSAYYQEFSRTLWCLYLVVIKISEVIFYDSFWFYIYQKSFLFRCVSQVLLRTSNLVYFSVTCENVR